jgi:chromosome segregation ATPase
VVQDAVNKEITLDDLLRIVDTAARTIERLQAVNASLMQQIRECESAAQAAADDADSKARQIDELEKSEAMLREDAEWCRWFKNKYSASTFYSHIEREYQAELRGQDLPGEIDAGVPPTQSDVTRDAS